MRWLVVISLFLLSRVNAQQELHLTAYYAPQFGGMYPFEWVIEGTLKNPAFLGGKYGVNATYYFDKSRFGLETGISRSFQGANMSVPVDSFAGGVEENVALWNQQFVYTKIPLYLTYYRTYNDLWGINFKFGFELGILSWADNRFWWKGSGIPAYQEMTFDDVVTHRFSRNRDDDQLLDFVHYFANEPNADLTESYQKIHWAFNAEIGITRNITDEFDLMVNLFADIGLSDIENKDYRVNDLPFWHGYGVYWNYQPGWIDRPGTFITNFGIKAGIRWRLWTDADPVAPPLPEGLE